MEPLCVQVPGTSRGKMSCAVSHLQPTLVWREAAQIHQKQTSPNQISHTVPAALLRARELIHIIPDPLAVRV